MRRGWELRIAAALCAGMAGCLLVSSGCSTLVSGDAAAHFSHWLDTVPASATGSESPDAPLPVVTVASVPEEPVDELSAAEDCSAVGESVPTPDAELAMDDVLAYTLQNHPALCLRQQEVQLARARLTGAGLLPNPQLVLNTETELESAHRSDLATRLTFTIPTGPKRRLRTDAAQAGVQASQAALSREMKAVLAEATDAAVAVLYWQERIALERQFRDLAEQAAEIRRELFQINEVPYRDTVATEMALADALLAERDAATRLRLAQLRLARAMGVDPVNAPALCGRLEAAPLPPIPLETVLDCARNAAPELVQADCDVAASRAQLAYEKWRTLPDLTIGPRYRHAFSDDPEGIGARVEVDLPVFDWNQANIAASAAQLQSNAARSRMAELATVGDVAELYLELRAVDADLEYYTRQLLPMAERATTTLQQAFRERAVGAAELVDLLQQAGRIRKSHLDLRWQHVRLRARLEVLLEQPLCELAADAAGDPVPIPADHAATVE